MDAQKYIAALPYEFIGADLDKIILSAAFLEKINNAKSAGDLMRCIKEAHCFGVMDSIVVEVLNG